MTPKQKRHRYEKVTEDEEDKATLVDNDVQKWLQKHHLESFETKNGVTIDMYTLLTQRKLDKFDFFIQLSYEELQQIWKETSAPLVFQIPFQKYGDLCVCVCSSKLKIPYFLVVVPLILLSTVLLSIPIETHDESL